MNELKNAIEKSQEQAMNLIRLATKKEFKYSFQIITFIEGCLKIYGTAEGLKTHLEK